jgi:hypothetical protein
VIVFVIDFCSESGLVYTFILHDEERSMLGDKQPLLSLVPPGDVE